jgi:hypothetical protein
MHVFVSHAASDREVVATLRADLATIGRQVLIDVGEPSGLRWWDGVLRRIQGCEAFIFVLSHASLASPGCMAELRYARMLRRPVLVVRVQPMSLPVELADVDVFDPARAGADHSRALRAALKSLPTRVALPDPLPRPPLVPYLDGYHEQLDLPALDRVSQHEILAELRRRLANGSERAAVWDLLIRLRARPDVAPGVSEQLEKTLAPGWWPDPDGRVERRYWDGQAWTTLVRHEGREYNERRAPQQAATWSAGSTTTSAPRGRRWWWRVGAVAVVVVGLVVGGILYFGEAPERPTRTARVFVDAVNLLDVDVLTGVVCSRDRSLIAQEFGSGGYRLTLESVDDKVDPPTFTVLSTDLRTGDVDRRTYPLINESGEWRVCSL